MKLKNLSLQPATLLAELIGTFVLTTVALVTQGNLIILGFTMIVLVLSVGSVSGAHVNPAVTFGLWSVKKLEGIKVPFYWIMQFAGALLALLLFQWFKGGNIGLSFDFNHFDMRLVLAEVAGAAAFTFAISTAIETKLTESAKALSVGLGLLVGLAVGGGLLGAASQSQALLSTAKNGETLRVTKVDGAVINPAIALAVTNKDEAATQSLTGDASASTSTKQPASRFTWETVVGALVGGALGANLALLTLGVNPMQKEKVTARTTVTKIFKKGKK